MFLNDTIFWYYTVAHPAMNTICAVLVNIQKGLFIGRKIPKIVATQFSLVGPFTILTGVIVICQVKSITQYVDYFQVVFHTHSEKPTVWSST